MAFQPLGYRFDIRSPMGAQALKHRIRGKMRPWFHKANGPRGWIVGRVICLWLSAFDAQGPMLIGWISEEEGTTHVRGRAGSDLNGTLSSFLLLAIFAAFAAMVVTRGDRADAQLLGMPILIFLIPILILVLWAGHLFRRDADPLVRFLRDMADPERAHRLKGRGFARALSLSSSSHGDEVIDADAANTRDALRDAGSDDVVILSAAPEEYLQTRATDGRFVIERRDGDWLRHYQARRADTVPANKPDLFSFDEAVTLFLAWGEGATMPGWVAWERIEMPPPDAH